MDGLYCVAVHKPRSLPYTSALRFRSFDPGTVHLNKAEHLAITTSIGRVSVGRDPVGTGLG
jgi:hypothetical protein